MVGNSGLETLLLHELAHIRRRDHLLRLLEFAALGLFWWNPVAWFARREMREVEEQCCDAWVVRTLPGTGRTYATALVDALDFLCGSRPALPPLASGLGEVADLKRRLKMILSGKTPHGLGWSNGLAVLGLALFLLPLVPVWGRAQDTVKSDRVVINERNIDVLAAEEEELKKMQADIEKRAAELAALKAKMEQVKRAAVDSAKKKLAARLDVLKQRVGETRAAGPTIRIEIIDTSMKTAELQEVLKKLQAVLGKDSRIVLVVNEKTRTDAPAAKGAGEASIYRFRSTAPDAKAATPFGGGAGPKGPASYGFGTAKTPFVPRPPTSGQGTSADKRIDNLEKKLDLLLRELEALRREMRRGGPRGGGGGAGGAGGGFGAPAKREVPQEVK
jgi:hypothetical protein